MLTGAPKLPNSLLGSAPSASPPIAPPSELPPQPASIDTANATAKSVGLGFIGFADAYEDLQPDMVVVLGDRYEIISAVSTALFYKIPVAHLHGGEITVVSEAGKGSEFIILLPI